MRIANGIFSALLLALMLGILYMTLQIPSSPNPNVIGASYVPMVYVIVGILLSVLILINSIKEKAGEAFKLDKKYFLYVLIAIAYMFSINIIGYYFSSILLIVLLYLLLGIRKWSQLLLIPILYALFIYIVFERIISLPVP
ncbi:hypothetical protein GCM10011409_27240 [Lentibacillus populi]|uniref:DUF1468 domain-containing protein n=1 Tax=Lentibacillus populi TaxID=1827502 RepID=A0A9W5TZR4_9BACI|nr:tripartite tricarboxylate transporter TctB family protein [Lentibacillus populi]GGB48231.1 hypothetical protein GCM10011409_27240 [Lentibacillus populi]